MSAAPPMKINRLAPWFGCDLAVADRIAALLAGCAHVTIPFAGSASVVPLLTGVRSGILNDLHRHVVNLFRAVRNAAAREELHAILQERLFHPDVLFAAQRACIEHEDASKPSLFGGAQPMPDDPDPEWAADYFTACWMGRGGHAGKATEFTQNLAVRFTASGGDSAVRFRSAVDSLDAWAAALERWQCTCEDVFALLSSVVDSPEHGIYLDPPWIGAGDEYRHRFTRIQHLRLVQRLVDFEHARVVVRYGDDPLIRELYTAPLWTIEEHKTRDQQNGQVAELLIHKGGAV